MGFSTVARRRILTSSKMAYREHDRNTRTGFSLIELMVALTLGSLLLAGVLVVFSATSRVTAEQSALSRLQDNGRTALQVIAGDLRLAGYMPCGSRVRPLVYANALASHISGAPSAASAPTVRSADKPYSLNRGIFLGGNTCKGTVCEPALIANQDVPRSGLAAGDKIPGTDVLTVRFLQGSGWAANTNGSKQLCDERGALSSIAIHRQTGDSALDGFKASHVALLVNCTAGEIFDVATHGETLQPLVGTFGAPSCLGGDSQTRLFDFDAQLNTSVYYLQLVGDHARSGHAVPTLMRRINGVASEVAQGVERLDVRYSIVDAAMNARWVTAGEIERSVATDGAPLLCKMATENSANACTWSDVDAVEVWLLVDTVDDLPEDPSDHAWDYRYSIDGDQMHSPTVPMPVTGLPSGRMLRREFRSVIALRSLGT